MKPYTFLLSILAIGLVSCDQTYNYVAPPQETFETVEKLNNATVVPPDTFTVDNSKDVRVVTDEEAELLLSKCALALPDGTPLCNLTGDGPCIVRVELFAIFRKKDMVLNEMVTQTLDGQLMESGGMAKVKATFNDSIPLIVREGESFKVKLPKTNTLTDSTKMEFYLEDGDLVTDTLWVYEGELYDQDEEDYIIEHTQFNEWMSIGYLHESPHADTLLAIQAGDDLQFKANQSQVYVSLEDFHSIIHADFSEGTFQVSLPGTSDVRAVGIHTDGTLLYYGSATGKMANDEALVLELSPQTPAQIEESLKELEE